MNAVPAVQNLAVSVVRAAFIWLLTTIISADAAEPPILWPRNVEVPFSWLPGGHREWPITIRSLAPDQSVYLTARRGNDIIGSGHEIHAERLSISVSPEGQLRVTSFEPTGGSAFQLEIRLDSAGRQTPESQVVELRPAPPDRPISYYADFGDDLILMFMNQTTGQFRTPTQDAFDQYFRRLQAHGMKRLIVWLSPFPYIADPQNYAPEDWERYAAQARAIIDDPQLTEVLGRRSGFTSWGWLRFLMSTRLSPEFGRMLGQSAEAHGIELTVSFRPFEAALTKYYEVPAFDADGTWLWGFLPLASPLTTYHPERVSWAHYRTVLRESGKPEICNLTSIEFSDVTDAHRYAQSDSFRVTFSDFPPTADDSFVLVRDERGRFQLQPFSEIRSLAEQKRHLADNLRAETKGSRIVLKNIRVPASARYITVEWVGQTPGPEVAALVPVELFSSGGNKLGRETTYWVRNEPTDLSRIAGITADGEYRAEFQASEFSQKQAAAGAGRIRMGEQSLVIDLGSPWSVEMLDFNQPETRQNAVRELRTILGLPGFDSILLNTRSHVDLPLSVADGDAGQLPAGRYWQNGGGLREHLGLDKAYLPRSTNSLAAFEQLSSSESGIRQILEWQASEWREPCQTPKAYPWRYLRNQGTADGIRSLLEDLEREFPGTPVRAVIPHSEAGITRILKELDSLRTGNGEPFGRKFFSRLWPSNNYIPAVGEGMAMVNLSGLSVEPVISGSGGYLPEQEPFAAYVRASVDDLADNRGSSYRGPKSYFFEAQMTLRAADPAAARRDREEMIRHLLSQSDEIDEVILYEAADWLYYLSLSDHDLCGHGFLDRCPPELTVPEEGADQ